MVRFGRAYLFVKHVFFSETCTERVDWDDLKSLGLIGWVGQRVREQELVLVKNY